MCIHCGEKLVESSTGMARTTRNTGGIFTDSAKIPETLINKALIPEDGIAVYAAGTLKPYYLHVKKEIIIGRKFEDSTENFLDLSGLDGFNLGLSRRHVMIRKAETGYEITDLSSTNGTWMDDERLVPERPYHLKNGAQLRIGRLRLLIVHHSVGEPSAK